MSEEPTAVLLPHKLISEVISLRQLITAKVFFNKMIGQKTIHSFFSPVSKKRISKDINEAEEDAKDPVSEVTSVCQLTLATCLACSVKTQRY